MIETILILAGAAVVSNIINIFISNNRMNQKSISLKKYMPGDLPIITLSNNGIALNFLIDTGSNISHICYSVVKDIKCTHIGSNTTTQIAGLGAMNRGVTICSAVFKDCLSKEYQIQLSISKELEDTVGYIKDNTGVEIHGLLGTDFLQKYKYIIDFKSLEVYTKN